MKKQRRGREIYYWKVCPNCNEERWIGRKGIYCSRECAQQTIHKDNPVTPKHFQGTSNEYANLHQRLYRRRGKANKCVNGCIATDYQWANLTGQYGKVRDYIMMCRACHYRFDKWRVAVIVTHKSI